MVDAIGLSRPESPVTLCASALVGVGVGPFANGVANDLATSEPRTDYQAWDGWTSPFVASNRRRQCDYRDPRKHLLVGQVVPRRTRWG